MTSAEIAFGEGPEALKRQVRLTHLIFPKGGSWSLFLCPSCGRRCRTLRLFDGRLVCRQCDGLMARCQMGDKSGVIERLRQRLYNGKPDRRARVAAALRRALIRERRKHVP